MKAREELKAWLERSGTRQTDLARQIGTDKVRLCRLLSGRGTLEPAQLGALERVTGIAGLAIRLAAEGPRGRKRKTTPMPEAGADVSPQGGEPEGGTPLDALRALVGDVPPDVDPVGAFGDRFGIALLGGLLKLALTAKAEGTRLRALESLADRVFGKPVQRVRDETPHPPAESPELIELFESMAKPHEEPSPAREDGAA